MRYLGIDYGAKRIGLALSDPEERMAFPYGTVGHVDDVMAVVKKEGVGGIFIGFPKAPKGLKSGAIEALRRFAAELGREVQLPIVFEDEMFTTKIAEEHTVREKADAAAAALILQSYLDRQVKRVK